MNIKENDILQETQKTCNKEVNTYIVVYCESIDLDGEWIYRTPIWVLTDTDRLKEFQRYGFEIFVADADGKLKRIQAYYTYEPKGEEQLHVRGSIDREGRVMADGFDF